MVDGADPLSVGGDRGVVGDIDGLGSNA
ncbi:MAG: hypothetical protein QOD39_3426, partial [Mycobacterium sp.]|nr:hypothetical protein [Mycobacterium sp.]